MLKYVGGCCKCALWLSVNEGPLVEVEALLIHDPLSRRCPPPLVLKPRAAHFVLVGLRYTRTCQNNIIIHEIYSKLLY
jgi:hypothetical protein